MNAIVLKQVHKNYGATNVIHGVDLTVEEGEFCVFVGPSGCRKSTLLGMIAGLEDITEGASSTRFYDFEADRPETRFNDGRNDRRGRLIVGGMNEVTNAADSSVVRVDPDGSVTTLIEHVAISNSICFSLDGGTLYFTNTPSQRIFAYPYDQDSGTVDEPSLFADLSGQTGSPDGSCVDRDGGLWNAKWGGSSVACHDGMALPT